MLPQLGGWSGFVRCAGSSRRFRNGMLRASQSSESEVGGLLNWRRDGGATALDAAAAAADADAAAATTAPLPRVYLSTDSPALQSLALESFPDRFVTVAGEPSASWDSNLTAAE